MEIEIKGFRGIENGKFTFNKGVNLVLGKSGSGKTTIFRAIEWLLYGSMRLIATKGASDTTSTVCMRIPSLSLKIYRKNKGPPTFEIRENKTLYTGQEAEAWVVERFGSKESWLASCSVAQFMSNNFFQASNAIKRKTINIIAYGEEDPEKIIDLCDEKVKMHKKLQEEKEAQLQLLESRFSSYPLRPERSADRSVKRSAEKGTERRDEDRNTKRSAKRSGEKERRIKEPKRSVKEIQKAISTTQKVLEQKREEREEYLKYQSRREQTSRRLQTLREELEKIEDYLQLHPQESPDIALLQSLPAETSPVLEELETLEEVEKHYRQELQVEEAKKLFRKYGLKYAEGEIEKAQERYQEYLQEEQVYREYLRLEENYKKELFEYQKEQTALKKLRAVKEPQEVSKPDELTLFVFDYDEGPIREAEENVRLRKAAEKTLVCPCCDALLRLEDGELLAADQNLRNFRGEIQAAEKKLKLLLAEKDKARREHERESKESQARYKRELEDYHQYLDNQRKYQQAQEQLAVYEERGFLEAPKALPKKVRPESVSNPENISYIPSSGYSLSALKKQEEYLRNQARREKILAQCSETRSLAELLEEQKQIRNKKEAKKNFLSEEKKLQEELNKKTEVSEVSKEDLEALEESIELARQELQDAEIYARWLEQKQEIDRTKLELAEIETKHQQYLKLHKYTQKFHLSRLVPVINTINKIANEFLEPLFEEPIALTLSTFRKTTTGKTRQQFDIKITRQGHEYNLDDLSGGQKMRVSIAITLAFNQFRGFPIMMFDESLSSLDPETSRRIVQFISRRTASITLIAAHGATEGDYDHVVDLDS